MINDPPFPVEAGKRYLMGTWPHPSVTPKGAAEGLGALVGRDFS